MYVRPRLRVRPRNGGILAFSPASLFTSGVQGAWYDPSDINSYMAGLGAELVPDSSFDASASWTPESAAWVVSGGKATYTSPGSGVQYLQSNDNISIVSGAWYKVTFTLSGIASGNATFGLFNKLATVNYLGSYQIISANGEYSLYFLASSSTTGIRIYGNASSTATSWSFDSFSIKQVTSIGNATMFQDSAGTTPVTAVEQPVGLMLDKSQGLSGSGSQLVTNGDFSSPLTTGWQSSNGGSFAVVSNRLQVTGAGATGTGAAYTLATIVGMTYSVSYDVVLGTAAVVDSQMSLSVAGGASIGSSYQYSNVSGTFKYSFVATATTTYFQFQPRGTGNTASIDNFSVMSLGMGNHASQATTASRPVLRARYNLLTYSEQFDNAAWAKRSAGTVTTVTANTTVAPDGTLTADTISDVSTSDYAQIDNGSVTAGIANTNYTFSLYVLKDAVTSRFPEFLLLDNTNSLGVCIQLNTSTGAVANRTVIGSPTYTTTVESAGLYWRLIHTIRTGGSATTLTAFIRPVMSATLGGAVDTSLTGSIVIWGADLRTGSSAGTYQRIAAATDYATAGFLPYLALDGTDDSFGTGSIDFSATDKMTVCAGITKLSDAAGAIVVELSSNFNSNTGSWFVAAPSDVLIPYSFIGRGAGAANANQTSAFGSGTFRAPDTCVLTATGDISGDANILRRNSTAAATGTFDQGSGNYGNYPLYIGRRANTSLPLNGRIYQLIVCGKTLSASELASTESFVAAKTGVAI